MIDFQRSLRALSDRCRPEPLDYAKRTFANHRVNVIREDGVYRHIRVAEPGTRMYGFEVVTYPYYLVVTGDIGTFVFSRVEDMLTFFQQSGFTNYDYWHEKLQAPTSATEFDADVLLAEAIENGRAQAECLGWEEDVIEGLIGAIQEDASWWGGDERTAVTSLMEFNHEGIVFEEAYELPKTKFTTQFELVCNGLRALAESERSTSE